MADVPVGIVLSGGLDSSLVAAVAHEAAERAQASPSLNAGPSQRAKTTRIGKRPKWWHPITTWCIISTCWRPPPFEKAYPNSPGTGKTPM